MAPFKAVLTDGFVMDEHGRKMSKSLGNVVAPEAVANKYGVDILRLWVMMSDTTEDLRIGPEILKQQAELYRRLRNTLRWVLGSLDGFTEAERVPVEADAGTGTLGAAPPDRARRENPRRGGESYDWTGVYPEMHNFCAIDLSAFYFDIRKDAVYCDRPDSLRRRAARTVLDHLHRCLCTWLAPVLCFTAEEAWCARFGEAGQRASATVSRRCRQSGATKRWRRSGRRSENSPPHHRADRGSPQGQHHRLFVAGRGELPLTAATRPNCWMPPNGPRSRSSRASDSCRTVGDIQRRSRPRPAANAPAAGAC